MAQLVSAGLVTPSGTANAVLTGQGRETAAILKAPASHIMLRIWGTEQAASETSAYFPENPGQGRGIILNQADDGTRHLVGMADITTLISLAAKMIPADREDRASEHAFEAHLDAPTAAVLCAVLDIARTAYRRQGFPDIGLEQGTAFSIGDIAGYLDAAWAFSEFDQLISYLPPTTMQAHPPNTVEIDAAVQKLTSLDYLKEAVTGRLMLCESLRQTVPVLYGLRSGFQWQRISYTENDETLVSHRIFLIGLGQSVLAFSPTLSGHVYMALCPGDDIARFLSAEASELIPLKTTPQKDGTPHQCTICGTPVRPNALFCTNCGKNITTAPNKKDAPATCKRCGKELRPEAKFCTKCGLPVPPA
jgi:hypothetical protein